jgi:hypothetical protein
VRVTSWMDVKIHTRVRESDGRGVRKTKKVKVKITSRVYVKLSTGVYVKVHTRVRKTWTCHKATTATEASHNTDRLEPQHDGHRATTGGAQCHNMRTHSPHHATCAHPKWRDDRPKEEDSHMIQG